MKHSLTLAAAIVTGLCPGALGIGRNINDRDDPLPLRGPCGSYPHIKRAIQP